MPNTLAHAGFQGLGSRTILANVDLKWVYLGCVIPDLPWIFRRAVHFLALGIDPFALRSYAIIQASLFGCLIFSAAIALFARRIWTVLAVLSGNAILHVGLDAMQTKWGNGVHLFAPFSWEITNWGLFWPESVPTYVLTAVGLLYIAWHWQSSVNGPLGLTWPDIWRLTGALVLLGGYFAGPLFLLHEPIDANTHSLKTLSMTSGRTGRSVEIDRASYVETKGQHFLDHYGGRVQVEKLRIQAPAVVSIRGVFVDENMINVKKLHVHSNGLRDYPSYLGLGLIAMLWFGAWFKGAPR